MKTMQTHAVNTKEQIMIIKVADNYGYQQATTHIPYGSVIKKALLYGIDHWYIISTNH
jgi:hypothetical protein